MANKLKAKITSQYYLSNNEKKVSYTSKEIAYQILKLYIDQHKSQFDIIEEDPTLYTIKIRTKDKTLPLDRFVYIDQEKVDINDLNNNLKD